jgi:hypothetical protein
MDTVIATLFITCNNEELNKTIELYHNLLDPGYQIEVRQRALHKLRYFIQDPNYKSCSPNLEVMGLIKITEFYQDKSKANKSYYLGHYMCQQRKFRWYPMKQEKSTI